jgi:hypothetical protein
MPGPDNYSPPSEWKSTRFWLAVAVTAISISAVTILATLVIRKDGNPQSPQNVLNSVLPLLGTWIGTILAYYFSKENFEAATNSVTELARQMTPQQKLQSTPVKSKMIWKQQMFAQKLPADQLKLTEMLNQLEQAKKGNRIPIVGDKDEPKYILHRSLIDGYIASLSRGGRSVQEIAAQTLKDMLDGSAEIKRMAEGFSVIKEDATLADAQSSMANIRDCQDVFVTQLGTKDEGILGWVTNVIIQENARV